MPENIKNYDFKKPQRYSSDNMRFLSVISEDFCKHINLHIAYELKRHNITCKLERVEQTNFEEFTNMTKEDSVIVEHAIQPLVKGLIFQMDKEVVLTLIDLLLGGEGTFDDSDRELTQIDKYLIHHASTMFINRLYVVDSCTKRDIVEVHTNIGSSQKFSVSESVLVAHMAMYDGNEEIGKLRFCEPYCCMEPILDQLETKKLLRDKDGQYDFEFANAIYQSICNVNADIVATLGKTNIDVKDLTQLQVGDVLKLETKSNEEITLSVNGASVYNGIIGLMKNKRGVLITDTIKKDV